MPWRLLHVLATFVVSVALALYFTPIVRKGALHFGVLDHPDGRLKRQAQPVAYLGGIAIYLTFIVTLGILYEFDAYLLGLLLGGTMMVMLGLFDDMKVLPPGLKLAGQLLGALILIKSGIAIQLEFLPLWGRYAATVLWLLAVTNAVNILDVRDGLAAGTSAIAALALAVVALLNGDPLVATTAVALAGCLFGFLRFNWPPARIYLGDAGSLFVGFMLAALAMIGAYTRHTLVGALAPLCILSVPLFELALVSIARSGRRIAPWRGSGDHFALRLEHHGWSIRAVVLSAYVFAGVGAAVGVAVILVDTPVALGLAIGVAATGLVAMGLIWRRCPPPY